MNGQLAKLTISNGQLAKWIIGNYGIDSLIGESE
jgi:hypothetical protein